MNGVAPHSFQHDQQADHRLPFQRWQMPALAVLAGVASLDRALSDEDNDDRTALLTFGAWIIQVGPESFHENSAERVLCAAYVRRPLNAVRSRDASLTPTEWIFNFYEYHPAGFWYTFKYDFRRDRFVWAWSATKFTGSRHATVEQLIAYICNGSRGSFDESAPQLE